MNLPNMLTLSRVPFLFVIAALTYWRFPFSYSLAFVVFVMAGLTDWLDGKIARDLGMISVFGQLMDALTDKILTVGLFVTFFGGRSITELDGIHGFVHSESRILDYWFAHGCRGEKYRFAG